MQYLYKTLQEAYSALWSKFQNKSFTLNEAVVALNKKESAVLNILSLQRRRGWVVVNRRKRKRLYRLIEPNEAMFALASIANLEKVQGRYLPVIIKVCRLLITNLGKKLHAIVLYGSIARGNQNAFSDIDLLVVADDLGKSLNARLDAIYTLIKEAEVEIEQLRTSGIFTEISLLPLTKKEAGRFIPIYLDISQDGIILYDSHNFFAKLMKALHFFLEKANVRRKHVRKQWYWELNPKKEFGVIEVES